MGRRVLQAGGIMICNYCEKDSEELYTREGFVVTHYIEWVCEDCFKVLEKTSFEEYGEDDVKI